MDNPVPNIFVVDDDPSVRKGLGRLLRSMDYLVETFGSAEEFLQTVSDCPGPACLVLDVKMPGLDGLDLQKQLQQRDYIMPIVFITGHGDIPMSVKAMKTGAIDFLTKPFDEKDLLKAVQEALKKDITNRSAMNEREGILERVQTLTPREYEILTYVITGLLNKQIAYVLDISEKTVKVHRGRVMEKLVVDSVAQLVRLAEKAGIEPAAVQSV
jgi:two-component system, LuxR family, response regulator FixJ